MDPIKLQAVQNWPRPAKVKDIQKFLGFCNFYRHFVRDYSHLACPLFNLTKKNEPWNWMDDHEQAFQSLQKALTSSPVLLLPDYGKAFTLITDASDFATGAILEQEDAYGRSHPVAYYSKSLQPAERNYEIHDKELLAIVHALKHFRHYLQGNPHVTKIFSDHVSRAETVTVAASHMSPITRWQSQRHTPLPRPRHLKSAPKPQVVDNSARDPGKEHVPQVRMAARPPCDPEKRHVTRARVSTTEIARDHEKKHVMGACDLSRDQPSPQ